MGYPAEIEVVDVVFDGPPGHQPGQFVEVEDAQGRSIRLAEDDRYGWRRREDGLWSLRLPIDAAVIAGRS